MFYDYLQNDDSICSLSIKINDHQSSILFEYLKTYLIFFCIWKLIKIIGYSAMKGLFMAVEIQ